jgi:hypothetical protein
MTEASVPVLDNTMEKASFALATLPMAATGCGGTAGARYTHAPGHSREQATGRPRLIQHIPAGDRYRAPHQSRSYCALSSNRLNCCANPPGVW